MDPVRPQIREQPARDCASLDWPANPYQTLIKQRPTAPTADRSKTPAIWTELRKEGLTPGGPLQKPGNLTLGDVGLLTDAAPTSVDERPGFGRFEDSKRQCRSSAAGVAARSGVYVASALSGSCQIAVFLSLACAKLNSC